MDLSLVLILVSSMFRALILMFLIRFVRVISIVLFLEFTQLGEW